MKTEAVKAAKPRVVKPKVENVPAPNLKEHERRACIKSFSKLREDFGKIGSEGAEALAVVCDFEIAVMRAVRRQLKINHAHPNQRQGAVAKDGHAPLRLKALTSRLKEIRAEIKARDFGLTPAL